MAHPLTHLTHGIPTRRPFHPAAERNAVDLLNLPDDALGANSARELVNDPTMVRQNARRCPLTVRRIARR
jgi:hypothetical protein